MWENWVQFLGWEDPLEEGMATHSSILPGEFYGQRSLADYSQWGHKELDTTERLSTAHGVNICFRFFGVYILGVVLLNNLVIKGLTL